MAKPLDEQTDEELETALAQGQLDERKAATAKEILSRRWQSKSEKIKGSYGWLGHVDSSRHGADVRFDQEHVMSYGGRPPSL
jgi:hypothetical protein